MTREQLIDRDEAVLRAKVTLTQEQLVAIITTHNDGTWRKTWDGLPHDTMAFWLPLDQIDIDYVVVRSDCPPSIPA